MFLKALWLPGLPRLSALCSSLLPRLLTTPTQQPSVLENKEHFSGHQTSLNLLKT